MKHIRPLSRPSRAQMSLGDIVGALAQIIQLIGALLIEKDVTNPDPYDW